MAASAITTTTTTLTSKQIIEGLTKHEGHDISNVGPVRVKGMAAGIAAGSFHVWYCQNDNELFLTLTD